MNGMVRIKTYCTSQIYILCNSKNKQRKKYLSKVKVMCILLEKSFFLYFYRTFLQNNFFQKRYKKYKKLFITESMRKTLVLQIQCF